MRGADSPVCGMREWGGGWRGWGWEAGEGRAWLTSPWTVFGYGFVRPANDAAGDVLLETGWSAEGNSGGGASLAATAAADRPRGSVNGGMGWACGGHLRPRRYDRAGYTADRTGTTRRNKQTTRKNRERRPRARINEHNPGATQAGRAT